MGDRARRTDHLAVLSIVTTRNLRIGNGFRAIQKISEADQDFEGEA
jgi:hypothetical protein